MKYKVLFAVLAAFLLVTNSFAQNVEVSVSMENKNLWGRKDFPVKVKITNKAEDNLDTKILKGISFCFSKRLKFNEYGKRGEKYTAFAEIPQKLIKENESFEFEVNLSDLYWADEVSSSRNLKSPKNLSTIPVENRIFYAVVRVFTDDLNLKEMTIPISNSFASNQILTTFKP